ncbi:tRNA uracil 4-sulfurtransferase ThiI [Thalassobacillus pellis]|uniref:tRNA uracil 4-sulfurtransferase ThiI n=1 Tax=Thalassobacillus pellis TaxID=748008 RepID=UPI00195FFB49|nr:tRNA uracil 4-sulfurtransferase ThiI [Thalassobacillus pellis]MBM7554949.1 thiamine biosynthesis protein ThiI [Thalassobacillus pellis]
MKFDQIMVRYGEMALKGKNRHSFENKLHSNLSKKLRNFPAVKIKKTRDRMYVLLNGENPYAVMEKCQEVFGIQSLSFAVRIEQSEDSIKAAALYAMKEAEGARTFKISTKRTDKQFPIRSQDMNQILGGHILSNTEGITVDVHNPDVEIKVEVRQDAAYVTSQNYPGAGGLPVGTTGKTLLLLSGGIDSPVAGYLAMKRGVEVEAVHFHSPPYTSERAKQKVLDLAQEMTRYGIKLKVHIIPFTKIQQKIHREMPDGYSMTIMRRMMLRISEAVAKEQVILSFTTGESLGQVASQTMESMSAINDVTNYPIIRPLVAMDKLEIIDISRKIGTYDISIRPYEDCCTVFVPKAPKTKPSKEKALEYEQSTDFSEDIKEALEQKEVISFSQKKSSEAKFEDLF